MKQYEVKTRFVFEGIFRVNAENREKARENVEKHCGLVMGGGIHSNLNDEAIDWNFNTHPGKKILHIKQLKKEK
jgi:hypothetical protein